MTECAFDQCSRTKLAGRGLCTGHYQQWYSGRTLTPLRKRGSPGAPGVRDEHGNKRCSRCEQWLPLAQFSISRKASDGLHTYCKPCMRDRKWLARYGVSATLIDELMVRQGGACAICRTPEAETAEARLMVDHDHAHCTAQRGCPDCIRGLLCRNCNIGIAYFHDTVELLQAAQRYLTH